MSTTVQCTTRYCLHCSTELHLSETPAGEPTLECPCCLHAVALSTLEESTLAEPKKLRMTLQRRLHAEALEVARELCVGQSEEWSAVRNAQFRAVLVFCDALQTRNAGELRRLLEVAS